jgi:hypothetical protein
MTHNPRYPKLLWLLAKMLKYNRIRSGEDEERAAKPDRHSAPAGNIEAHHTFSVRTMVRETLVKGMPKAWVDIVRPRNPLTTTSLPEVKDLLSEYVIPTPFVDDKERERETSRTAPLQEEKEHISAGYVKLFDLDDGEEDNETSTEQNPIEKMGFEVASIIKNKEREHLIRIMWQTSKNRKSQVSLLIKQGLSAEGAGVQADTCFDAQARGKGRNPVLAAFLLEANLELDDAATSVKGNKEA